MPATRFTLESELEFSDATDLLRAMEKALDAVADYSGDLEVMVVLSEVRNIAAVQQANAITRAKREAEKRTAANVAAIEAIKAK